MRKKFSKRNGITLMALILTIVLIFILLAIIISVYNNGKVIGTAEETTELHTIAKEKEHIKLAYQAEELRHRDTGDPITVDSFDAELKKMCPNTLTTEHEDLTTLEQYEIVVDRTDSTGYADVTFIETGHIYIIALIDDSTQYTVTFDPNGGSGGPDIQKKIENRTLTITTKQPTRNGYNFVGWGLEKNSTTPTYVGGDVYTENADLKLYAIWQLRTYYISYDLDGGTNPKNPTRYNMLTETFTLSNPTKQLYIFNGWTGTDLNEPTKVVTIPQGSTGDRKYTAHWDLPNYIIGGTKAAQTLKKAEELAEDGETIKVMRDVKDDSVASITKNVVLDLFGNTITMSNSINITQTGTLKIQDSGKENEYTGKILNTKTTAITNNGTLQLGDNDGTILISPTIQSATLGIDTKGIFKYYDGRVIGKTAIYGDTVETPTDYYAMAEVDSAEELETVELRTLGSAVCKIGFRYYSTIQEAVDAVPKGIQNDKKTIVMLVDLTVVEPVEMENKNLGLELAGKVITLSHEIHNTGILELTDSSAEQTGRLIFAEEGTSSNYAKGINNEGTFKLTSGQIENQKPYINIVNNSNNGTVEIAGGKIKLASSDIRGIYTESGKVDITGGEMKCSGSIAYLQGLYNNGANEINIKGGTIEITAYNSGYGAYNAKSGSINVMGGTIKSSSSSTSYVIYNASGGKIKVTGGTIGTTATSSNVTYGIYNSSTGVVEMIDGVIVNNARYSSSSSRPYGIYNAQTGKINITGGEIKDAETINQYSSSYGIYNSQGEVTITKGNINTKTYGIQNGSGTITIGESGGGVSITSPEIVGGQYGLYNGTGNIYFYDGVLKGKTEAFYGSLTATEENYDIKKETDEESYKIAYPAREVLVKIGETEYYSLQDAINSIQEGNTTATEIDMARNGVTILQVETGNRSIKLDLNGKEITLSHEIHNTGILELTDSSAEQTGRLIFAEEGTSSNYAKGINNEGTFKLTSGQIENQKPYINIVNNSNNGTVEIAGGKIKLASSDIRGIYTESGKVDITGGEMKCSGSIAYLQGLYNNGANEINIKGGTIEITAYNSGYGAYNAKSGSINVMGGTIKSSSSSTSYVIYNASGGKIKVTGGTIGTTATSSNVTYGIYNSSTGVVEMIDGVIVNNARYSSSSSRPYGIYNAQTGKINITGGEIKDAETINQYSSSYGIYNSQGEVTITKGNINTKTYGIQNGSGTITIGESGGGVSITSPEIVGGQYGLYNGTGNIYFYDGVLKGKTEASFGSYKGVENNYYIIDDYYVDENQDEYKVKYLIPIGSSITVATIGDVNYTSLQDAILACTVGNEVITMQKNISIDEEDAIVIDSSKNITINLNGKHININSTTTPAIQNNGTLTIKDSSSTDYGTIQNNSGIAIQNSGTLSVGVNDGIISLAAPRIIGGTTAIQNTGTLNYYDGIISGTKAVDGTINEVATGYSYSTVTNNNVQTITLKLTELDVKYTVNNFDITITGTGVSTVLDPNGDVHAADDTNSINFTFTATKNGTYIFRVTSSKGNIKVITVII